VFPFQSRPPPGFVQLLWLGLFVVWGNAVAGDDVRTHSALNSPV